MLNYRSKMVEPIRLLPRNEREERIADAGYNVFNLASEDVFIDLLTDSGTGTMSDEQWAALMRGDEAYAGSKSFSRLKESIEDVMGFEKIVPTHQGRGSENVLYGCLVEDGDYVPNNTHFDTTRAHIVNNGGDPVDCPVDEGLQIDEEKPFKGNISLDKVRDLADMVGAENIPAIVLTITSNSMAGQPVSMRNIRETRSLADELDAVFVIDTCRFAENAYFIKQRESRYGNKSVKEIALEMLDHADAIVMSGKKDGLVNVGGFVGVRDDDLFERTKQRGILYEGFTTYGGMAGRDLDAMAVGLREAVEHSYISSRVEQVRELGEMLVERDVPIYRPTGGHAVYVDAGDLLSHIPPQEFPGQTLACQMYIEGGVRAVELGSFAFPGSHDRPEFVRLALPRRMYHKEHLEHIAETLGKIRERRDELSGMRIVDEPDFKELRHFSAELEPV